MFVYGRDPLERKLKIRWYSARNIVFGEVLIASPFLLYRHPWILATTTDAQKELFNRYREFVLEYQTMAESLLFQNSFRLGAQMMLAVFGYGR